MGAADLSTSPVGPAVPAVLDKAANSAFCAVVNEVVSVSTCFCAAVKAVFAAVNLLFADASAVAVNFAGVLAALSVSLPDVDASNTQADASETSGKPLRSGYSGYLLGDGIPPNGADFGHGISFPTNAIASDYFLRIDMMPNRLFRYDGKRWVKVEDAVRHTLTNTDNRQTFRTGFINNNNWTYNQQLTSDNITISQSMIDNDVRIINTAIDYATYNTAPFVVINQSVIKLEFAVAEHPNLISSYTITVDGEPTQLIRLTLPADYHITVAGQWTITLYNVREAEKQSLSKALRPRADF
jgi:hypothetical protein